ncbi:hypothetical protein SCLCIDRAFT_24931 [Scleroderma citrinum Foug A]|uniref:Uncharacterized protein n=1 Tax=Scleroderma citrinum Foug A TaxID=1036808 RepID=A0A0C3ACL5_9AGAM|nr:hypothetical protein SCLCIDRAFT_24931 [Scleroderma citrinum Foug A]
MDDQDLLIPIATHLTLLNLPPGCYGISYDIFTRKLEDSLPGGWDSARSTMYSELGSALECAGFHRSQYSIYTCDGIRAMEAYWTMLMLMDIRPPGKLESTVKGLKLHYVSNQLFDVTDDIQLGGAYSPRLQGPMPAGLVPPNVQAAVLLVPLQRLPVYTRRSDEAMDVNNWRV